MRKENKLLLSGLLLAILPFSGAYAQSFADGGHRAMAGFAGPGDIRMNMRMQGLHGIDLSDEQRDDIRAIMDAADSNLRQTLGDLREKRQSLHEAIRMGDSDDSQLQSLSEEIGDLTGSLAYQQAQIQSSIYTILTEDQIETLNQRKEDRRQGFRERHRKRRNNTDPESP